MKLQKSVIVGTPLILIAALSVFAVSTRANVARVELSSGGAGQPVVAQAAATAAPAVSPVVLREIPVVGERLAATLLYSGGLVEFAPPPVDAVPAVATGLEAYERYEAAEFFTHAAGMAVGPPSIFLSSYSTYEPRAGAEPERLVGPTWSG